MSPEHFTRSGVRMFLGHYAVALAAKRVSPTTSLGTLVLASQFVDLLWPVLLLLGWEHMRIVPGITTVTPIDFTDYPISHSLLVVLVWTALVGGLYFAVRRSPRGAITVGALVLSHWFLDLLVHRPDLPLWPGSELRVGLGIWNSLAGTLLLELGLFVIGTAMYLRTTKRKDAVGTYGFWGFIVVLLGIYAANLLGPPPPGQDAIAIAGNASWLFVLWAWWVDRHRAVHILPQ